MEVAVIIKFSQQIKHSNTDEWYTPPSAIRLIVPYLRRKGFRRVLCPFDKEDSAYVSVLFEAGFSVSYSHIETGVDFFSIDNLRDYDCVVSNPPFSKRTAILARLFDSGVPFALIQNMNGLFDAKSRWELMRNNRFELLIPRGRIKFSDGDGVRNSPNFQSIYVCSGVLDRQIEFAEM